jgi:hypothetical protein
VAAGFDLERFWRLSPRSYSLMMRGAREGARARRLSMAIAVRAGTNLTNDGFEKWAAEVSGQDQRLPPDVLSGTLRRASARVETITMAQALKRMH